MTPTAMTPMATSECEKMEIIQSEAVGLVVLWNFYK